MAYRSTPRTEARRVAAREQIVLAALEQVADGGYGSASVSAVAIRAGVATGTVYRHFSSKAVLFAEVFRRASQRELDVVTELADRRGLNTTERIAGGAEVFARRALANPVLAFALLAEPVDPAVEAERLVFRRGYRDVFAAVLEDGIRAGEIDPIDCPTVAAALVGALAEVLVGPLSEGAASHRAAGPHRSEALITSLVQFAVKAIKHEEEPDVRRTAHA